jgi:hypothetical protein
MHMGIRPRERSGTRRTGLAVDITLPALYTLLDPAYSADLLLLTGPAKSANLLTVLALRMRP